MLSILFIFCIVWFGLVLDDAFSISRGDLPVRLASAVIFGCFWSTWVIFLLALAFGFNIGTVIAGTGIILAANFYAWRFRRRNLVWFTSLCTFDKRFWQAGFVPTVLITAYFATCVWIDGNGNIMFQGNSVDLGPHMGIVSAFLDQSAFPPLNPQSAAATLNYHFMADFFSAILCRGGFSLFYSLKVPMVLFAFALSSLTCHFLYSVLKTRTATVFAGLMFFFGHIGIINLLFGFAGYPVGDEHLSIRSWHSIEYHLTFPYFNFLNIVIDYFQPQLPFLFGWPLAMLILVAIYRGYTQQAPFDRSTSFLLALIAFLPLFHMHTFLTISPLVGLLALVAHSASRTPAQSRGGIIAKLVRLTTENKSAVLTAPNNSLALPPGAWFKIMLVLLAAIPIWFQFRWILSQSHPPGYSGFDVAGQLDGRSEIPNFLHLQRCWFWLRTAGPPLVLGLAGVLFSFTLPLPMAKQDQRGKRALLIMLSVTGFYFIVINIYRFTPNWGDSNKFVLYLDLVLCIYAGRLLEFLWNRSLLARSAAFVLVLFGAILPTTIDQVGGYLRGSQLLYSAGDRLTGEWIRINTPKDAVFLTANSIIHLVPALGRRRVVNGAFTRNNGFADDATEALVARAFRESNPFLITNCHVTHIFVGPQEEQLYQVNRAVLGRRFNLAYDQSCLGVRYSVYEIGDRSAEDIRRDQESENSRPFIWLSELQPVLAQQEYGTLKYDKSFDLTPLILNGTRYATGLGTHAHSDIRFNLDKKYSFFESDIGLDDSKMGGVGSVVFEIWVDDRKVYESKILRAGVPPENVKIDVSGSMTLKLIVTDAGDGNHCDYADWAGAKLVRKPSP